MGEVQDIGGAYSWSVSRLADCFGVDRHTLAKRIKAARLRPSGKHRGNPVYEIAEVAELIHGALDDPDEPLDLDRDPKARKDWFQSENERLKFEKEQRELIPVGEVEETVATAFAVVAHLLRAIPDNLERKRGLSGEHVEAVEKEIIEIQHTMADRLSELSDLSEVNQE